MMGIFRKNKTREALWVVFERKNRIEFSGSLKKLLETSGNDRIRALPLSESLNRKICGSLMLAQICSAYASQTLHIPKTLATLIIVTPHVPLEYKIIKSNPRGTKSHLNVA